MLLNIANLFNYKIFYAGNYIRVYILQRYTHILHNLNNLNVCMVSYTSPLHIYVYIIVIN